MEVPKKIADDGPAADARLKARRPQRIAVLLADAQDLAVVAESRHYLAHKCASVGEYGERCLGMSSAEARRLAAIGRVLVWEPQIQARLEEGRVTPEGVAA